MPDIVKRTLLASLSRLLRPLARIMLREGVTHPEFAAIAQMVFVESAAKDFVGKGMKSSVSSVCALSGMSVEQVRSVLLEQERIGRLEVSEIISNPFARVLSGWHNDRDYVGPYGLPVDLPFVGSPLSFSILAARHSPEVSPLSILEELQRIGAVAEVGANVWKPLKQEYLEPSLSPANVGRVASLVESLLSTLENNTRAVSDGTDLFERTMFVQAPLASHQLLELQSYLRVVGAQFLQRVDAFAAVELQEKAPLQPGDIADNRAGVQCFLYVEPTRDNIPLRDTIEFGNSVQ